MHRLTVIACVTAASCVTRAALGTVTTYTSLAGWQSASGPTSVATFSEFPQFTIVTDQYSESLGIVISSQTNGHFVSFNSFIYPTDGVGLTSGSLWVDVTFAAAAHEFFVQSSGDFRLDFYQGSVLAGTGGEYFQGPNGLTFGGFTTDTWFDRVRMVSYNGGGLGVDNFHFSTVPAPSAVTCLIAAACPAGRRRRRRR
jgi:hypothetical protein